MRESRAPPVFWAPATVMWPGPVCVWEDGNEPEKVGIMHISLQFRAQVRWSIGESTADNGKNLKVFNVAKYSADNVVSGICAAIVRVENAHFKAELDDDSVKQLLETNRKILEHEREVLKEHLRQEQELWEHHANRMRDILCYNKGIWMSEKVFYIVGSTSFISTFTILMYIVLWVYYHWIG